MESRFDWFPLVYSSIFDVYDNHYGAKASLVQETLSNISRRNRQNLTELQQGISSGDQSHGYFMLLAILGWST